MKPRVSINFKQLRYLKEEHCILVDKNDNSIGTDTKFNCHALERQLPLHRAFSLFLFHQNRLLLQKRSKYKVTWPLKWTNSCCSHPLSINGQEETMEEAINRKSTDELGIVPLNLRFMGKIIYRAEQDGWGEHELDHIFIGELDSQDVPFNQEEISEIVWVKKNRIEMIQESEMTPWIKLIMSRTDIYNMRPWPNIINFN
eukprot:NODE_234_length_13549_cov_0.394349.p5 type:complete len:200 gc:universal NODE_234_length_13549_cov_0.394349:12560-11961(-)